MMLRTLFILGIVGSMLSIYAYITERNIKQDATYKPFCDISDRISCSKPLLSPYSNLFFFSNALAGIIFYLMITILAYLNQTALIFYASLASSVITLVLAYLLYFKIQSFCILCTSLYMVNVLILFFAYKAMFK